MAGMLNETTFFMLTNTSCNSTGSVVRFAAVTLVLVFLVVYASLDPDAKHDIVKRTATNSTGDELYSAWQK